MPVKCELEIESLTTEAFSELDYVVMGHAFKCQNQFGRLADERIYEASLAAKLNLSHLESCQQLPIVVSHESFRKTFYLDLVVSRKGVYELKTVANLSQAHIAQLLTYLYLLDLSRGKLVNFRSPKVDATFVNAPLSRQERTSFAINLDKYRGDVRLTALVKHMLLDLGTALSVALYQEILVHLLGGESVATAMLPVTDGHRVFGNQRFQLVNQSESFHVTCFGRVSDDYEQQLRALLRFSPLQALHWINIDIKTVTFKTITQNLP